MLDKTNTNPTGDPQIRLVELLERLTVAVENIASILQRWPKQ